MITLYSFMQDDDDHPARAGEMPSRYPSLYDYHFDIAESCWFPWSHIVPKYEHDPELKYNQILVPTIDTTRTTWLLKLMVDIKRPVVLVGETGTSKTATIQVSPACLSVLVLALSRFFSACFAGAFFFFLFLSRESGATMALCFWLIRTRFGVCSRFSNFLFNLLFPS